MMPDICPMPVMRRYAGEDDYWRIRDFLRRTFLLNGRKEHSWQVARLDYWRWHGIANCGACPPLEEVVRIWEDPHGDIIAVLNPEDMGHAFLQIDPRWRSEALEEQMVLEAESYLGRDLENGQKRLCLVVGREDRLRRTILEGRGYHRGNWREYGRNLLLDDSLPAKRVPTGYEVRAQLPDDIPSRSLASWRAFHPVAPESEYGGHDWYASVERMPLYRRDLDIVAVGPGGEVAGFCTVWFDDVTRTGYLEPVGRRPEHTVHGLMRSVLLEGLQRLRQVGGDLATVGGCSFEANVLYASVMGTACTVSEPWIMEL